MTLDKLPKGNTAVIKKVNIRCNCVLRIMTLGLVENAIVKHITSTKHNLEILVHGSKMVISKHCASHIEI